MCDWFYRVIRAGGQGAKPEELAPYIDRALELDLLRDCGARFALNELTTGEWMALKALVRARAKGERERAEKDRAEWEAMKNRR